MEGKMLLEVGNMTLLLLKALQKWQLGHRRDLQAYWTTLDVFEGKCLLLFLNHHLDPKMH